MPPAVAPGVRGPDRQLLLLSPSVPVSALLPFQVTVRCLAPRMHPSVYRDSDGVSQPGFDVCPAHHQPAPNSSALSVGGERRAPSSEERPGDLGSEERQPSQSHPVRFPSRPWRPPSTGCPSSTPSSTPWRSMNQSLLSSTTKNT